MHYCEFKRRLFVEETVSTTDKIRITQERRNFIEDLLQRNQRFFLVVENVCYISASVPESGCT